MAGRSTGLATSGDHARVVVALRAGLLGLCLTLNAMTPPGSGPAREGLIAILVGSAMAATLDLRRRGSNVAWVSVETAVVTGAIALNIDTLQSFLPYLLAPALSLGLRRGWRPMTIVVATAWLVLLAAVALQGGAGVQQAGTMVSLWTVLALTTGLLGAWVRDVQDRVGEVNTTYAAAHRLLVQLRTVAKQLPGGLDEVTLARNVLSTLQESLPYVRGALFVRSQSGRLVPLAYDGAERVDWSPNLAERVASGAAETDTDASDGSGGDPDDRNDGRSSVPLVGALSSMATVTALAGLAGFELDDNGDPVEQAWGSEQDLADSRAGSDSGAGTSSMRDAGGVADDTMFPGEIDGLWKQAWNTGLPVTQPGTFSGERGGWGAVIPLRVGMRTFGLVGVERGGHPFSPTDLREASVATEEAALRLDTALLFSEVRTLATVEERRRLAREIHDGIAQELASLGYAVDDLRATAEGDEQSQRLSSLRSEITRLVSELRLSIFDLRSEVAEGGGIGAALSSYVRWVGASSTMTVRVLLDEGPDRLRVEVEAELLRIAQEAITNARKHAGARNLWVTCRVDPPAAVLRVEDDGIGLGVGRVDSFGISIMRERAIRAGGRLVVRPRGGGGTVVEVMVGEPSARMMQAAPNEGEGDDHRSTRG